MKTVNPKSLALAVCIGSMTLLAACNDSDNNDNPAPAKPAPVTTETIKGTAALGKAFVGKIVVKNKDGKESTPVTINADGTFEVTVPTGAPYLIKATNEKTGDQLVELYSYLADASKNINVTQLTTQAVFAANNQTKLANLYADWVASYTALTQAKIDEAAKKVAANLNAQFINAGYDVAASKKVNIFNDAFKAAYGTQAGTGIDKVLDKVVVNYNCNVSACNVAYTVNGAAYTWNYGIDTTGYTVVVDSGGNGPAGSGKSCLIDMDYDYSVVVPNFGTQTGTLAYKVCYENFPANSACSGGNQSLKSFAQAGAISGQIPGYSITVRKFDVSSVATCPSGVIKAVYK
jgi:hypothetical protein